MVLILLERAPASLKGELSRWLMELRSGVYLGTVSALVRDELWEICQRKIRAGGCMLVHPTNNEQGFTIRTSGELSRDLVNLDGLLLTCRRSRARDEQAET